MPSPATKNHDPVDSAERSARLSTPCHPVPAGRPSLEVAVRTAARTWSRCLEAGATSSISTRPPGHGADPLGRMAPPPATCGLQDARGAAGDDSIVIVATKRSDGATIPSPALGSTVRAREGHSGRLCGSEAAGAHGTPQTSGSVSDASARCVPACPDGTPERSSLAGTPESVSLSPERIPHGPRGILQRVLRPDDPLEGRAPHEDSRGRRARQVRCYGMTPAGETDKLGQSPVLVNEPRRGRRFADRGFASTLHPRRRSHAGPAPSRRMTVGPGAFKRSLASRVPSSHRALPSSSRRHRMSASAAITHGDSSTTIRRPSFLLVLRMNLSPPDWHSS